MTMTRQILNVLLVCGFLLKYTATAQEATISFSKDVRPILSNACFQCHGPDEESRAADLRLDLKEGLFLQRDNLTIVAPGNHSSSELIRRILSADPDEVMPPADANKPLSDKQKRVLVDWVRQGAPWEGHWAFSPPQRPSAPTPENDNWSRTAIDRFILSRIREAGLQPAPQAGPYTLVRRVYLDLTGLQPTPEEADAWVLKLCGQTGSNESLSIDEQQWQNLITHLLASPRYGERWARRWLDLARYADTNGYEKDRDRTMWPWRDWVVEAINEGMPFDQFTVLQLAGDMLPDATVEQRVATGFHRNTMLNEEGGIDPLEFRFHAMTDRVATTGTTWLGLTLGCCQCHTHKYDPISHHEYYQLMALLNNADEPSLPLPDESIDRQWAENLRKADELERNLAAKWLVATLADHRLAIAAVSADGGQQFAGEQDGFTVVSGPNPEKAVYTVEFAPTSKNFEAIRLATRPPGRHTGPGRTQHGNFVLTGIAFEVAPASDDSAKWQPLPIESAEATAEQDNYPVSAAFDRNEKTGWGIHASGQVAQAPVATFRIDRNILKGLPGESVRLRATLNQAVGNQHTIGAFRFGTMTTRSRAEIAALREAEISREFKKWRVAEREHAVVWQHLHPQDVRSNLPILTIQADDSIFASGDTAKRDDYFIDFAAVDFPVTALQLEALPDDRLPNGGPGSTYYEGTLGDFYLTEFQARSASTTYPFRSATETYARNRYGSNPVSAALAIDGDVQTGWSVHDRQGERHVAVFLLEHPVPPGTPVSVQLTFGRHFASSLGRFRLSATSAPGNPEARNYSSDIAKLIQKESSDLSDEEQTRLRTAFLLTAPQMVTQAEQIRKLRQRPGGTSAMVLSERPTGHDRPTYRHHRGEYLQPRDRVAAGLPEALVAPGMPGAQNRLEFARWLVSGQNALTARVVANRHWQAFFGEGIVRTLGDFGLQGESPSHPLLLDWLAVTLVETDKWSLKDFHRRIVSSAVYRQASNPTDTADLSDPDNRLLSFSPRFRLDAEIVRDQFLLAAGVLSDRMGGPPVRPLQPAGVSEVAYGNPKWNASAGTDRYRRSLYTYTKRTSPFAMFNAFDAPTGESCVAQRNRSNSPLQALTLLNDVMMMDLAQHAGERFSESNLETSAGLAQLFRSILVRPPSSEELTAIRSFFDSQLKRFGADKSLARDFLKQSAEDNNEGNIAVVAAWAASARALFGLDETLNRE